MDQLSLATALLLLWVQIDQLHWLGLSSGQGDEETSSRQESPVGCCASGTGATVAMQGNLHWNGLPFSVFSDSRESPLLLDMIEQTGKT